MILIAVLTAMLPEISFKDETAYAQYAVVLVSLGAAYAFTRDPIRTFFASRWVLIVARMAIVKCLYHPDVEGFPLENMSPDSSSNGATSRPTTKPQLFPAIYHFFCFRPVSSEPIDFPIRVSCINSLFRHDAIGWL